MSEQFFIPVVEAGPRSARLAGKLAHLGPVWVVEDKGPVSPGYRHFTSHAAVTAQERCFDRWDGSSAMWLVEDDVGGYDFGPAVRAAIAAGRDLSACKVRSMSGDPRWGWWSRGLPLYRPGGFEGELWASLNCFCRLSPWLVEELLRMRQRLGRFVFTEVMCATLARTRFDFQVETPEEIGKFWWGPALNHPHPRLIQHPLKREDLHAWVCGG